MIGGRRRNYYCSRQGYDILVFVSVVVVVVASVVHLLLLVVVLLLAEVVLKDAEGDERLHLIMSKTRRVLALAKKGVMMRRRTYSGVKNESDQKYPSLLWTSDESTRPRNGANGLKLL